MNTAATLLTVALTHNGLDCFVAGHDNLNDWNRVASEANMTAEEYVTSLVPFIVPEISGANVNMHSLLASDEKATVFARIKELAEAEGMRAHRHCTGFHDIITVCE